MRRLIGLIGLLLAAQSACAETLSAEAIFIRSAAAEKVPSWQADSSLKITRNGRSRLRTGAVYNKLQANGNDSDRLFRFRTPADIAGTAVLVHEHAATQDDLWIYFPSMAKTRRILASNKKDSFMGSDFAYADLMAQDSSDFSHALLADEACGETRCYVVESTPRDKNTAASLGYSKLIASIRQNNFTTFQVRYFDRTGKEFKRQTISGHVPAAGQPGKFVATRREMISMKGAASSLLLLDRVVSDRVLDDEVFIESRLGQ